MIRREVCTVVYEGAAVGKGRPRATTIGGRARMYTPTKTADYEAMLAKCAREALLTAGPMCVDLPIDLTVAVTRGPLKSWSRKKAEHMRGRCVTGKPDADNIAKAIADALNGVAYLDDAQIADLHITRRWGAYEEVRITVTALDEDAK